MDTNGILPNLLGKLTDPLFKLTQISFQSFQPALAQTLKRFKAIQRTFWILIAASISTVTNAAPTVWAENGNTYDFIFANVTWTQAKAAAEAATLPDGRTGHLVTISSEAENNFVSNLVGGDFRAWIGLTDEAVEGNYEWVTGEPLNFTKWSPGEPTNSGIEDYIELFASNDSWNDRVNTPFTAPLTSYIIEWEAVPEPFSIVIIPDTQMYTEAYPQIFEAQIDWIKANQDAENIIYVAHLGDLKDDRSCDNKTITVGTGGGRTEWEIVNDTFTDLEATTVPIPYGVVPGNHDYEPIENGEFDSGGNPRTECPNGRAPNALTTYNQILGPQRFSGAAFYGDPAASRAGNRVAGSNEDNFTLFEFGDVKFIAINLAYKQGANPEIVIEGVLQPQLELVWADEKLKQYSDRIGIVTSHYFVNANPAVGSGSSSFNRFGGYGQEVYDALSNNPNLLMMLSAHEFGEAWRVEDRTSTSMNPVHGLLSDYQRVEYPGDPTSTTINYSALNGGKSDGNSGFMRIMRFDPVDGMVKIETFAPTVPSMSRTSLISGTTYHLLSNETVTVGTSMDANTASNLSFTYLGYAVP